MHVKIGKKRKLSWTRFWSFDNSRFNCITVNGTSQCQHCQAQNNEIPHVWDNWIDFAKMLNEPIKPRTTSELNYTCSNVNFAVNTYDFYTIFKKFNGLSINIWVISSASLVKCKAAFLHNFRKKKKIIAGFG